MNYLTKKLEKIKQDINGYHDIVSDLRDEWSDLDGIFSANYKELKKYAPYADDLKVENDILESITELTDWFEECIFKSVDRIEKIQKEYK